MKKFIFVAATLVLVVSFFSQQAYAQQLKIGYIDVTKVFDGYKKTGDSEERLELDTKAKQSARDKFVSEITRLRDELDLLSEQGKQDKQQAIDAKIKELKEFDNATRSELKERRDEMVSDILREIDAVVQAYAKEKGYDLIFNDKVIIYKAEAMDVTEDILQALNKAYKPDDKKKR